MAVILGMVLVVMFLMNGALFYVLRTAVLSTRRQVEACFVKELEDYNGFLQDREAKSRQIEKRKDSLKKEIKEMEGVMLSLKTSPFYAPRPIARELFIPTSRYIDNEFFDNHKRVNDMMKSMDYQEIIDKIQREHAYQGNRRDYDTALRLLEFLDMEMSYELCTLSSDTQLETLKEALEGEEREMLDRFRCSLSEGEAFDVLKFRTFIREIRTAQDPRMYIRTGEKSLEFLKSDVELVHQYDRNISEGIRIIYQNQSYDFSIYRLRSRK